MDFVVQFHCHFQVPERDIQKFAAADFILINKNNCLLSVTYHSFVREETVKSFRLSFYFRFILLNSPLYIKVYFSSLLISMPLFEFIVHFIDLYRHCNTSNFIYLKCSTCIRNLFSIGWFYVKYLDEWKWFPQSNWNLLHCCFLDVESKGPQVI